MLLDACVVEMEGPDSAGHWSWRCTSCGVDASGFEPGEVEEAASEHGPRDAASARPPVLCLVCGGEGCEECEEPDRGVEYHPFG